MKPKVSVIVPVYNVEKYLRQCLDTIINQTLKEIEIILIDDGSTDSSLTICKEYTKLDGRIKLIHKENEGLGYTRNKGLQEATGEFVGFIDSDDWIELDMFEKLYQTAVEKKADTCLGNIKGKKLLFEGKEVKQELLPKMIGSKYDGTDYYGMSVWRGIYQLDLIKTHNVQFPSERELISEDIIFDIQYYSIAQKVVLIDHKFYYYRENLNSLTKRYRENRFDLYKKLYLEEERKIRILTIEEEAEERLQMVFYWNITNAFRQEMAFFTFKKAYQNMKKIAKDELVVRVIGKIPINKCDLKNRCMIWSMQHKITLLSMFIIKIRSARGEKNAK